MVIEVNEDNFPHYMEGLGYVKVVRCEYCKWHREGECHAWDDGTVAVVSETPDDGFCYRAERKEE